MTTHAAKGLRVRSTCHGHTSVDGHQLSQKDLSSQTWGISMMVERVLAECQIHMALNRTTRFYAKESETAATWPQSTGPIIYWRRCWSDRTTERPFKGATEVPAWK
ncbi:hypothetical protein CapIbe_008830 [Capra ibex]